MGDPHTAHTHTHMCAHPFAYWLNKAMLCQETETETETGTGTKKKKEQAKRTATHCTEPNRTEANRAPNHMRCIFTTCFGIFLNFQESGRGGERGQLSVAAADSRHQAAVSSGSSGHDFRLTSFAANISFVRRAAGKSEQTRGQRTMPLGMCNSAFFPAPPFLLLRLPH